MNIFTEYVNIYRWDARGEFIMHIFCMKVVMLVGLINSTKYFINNEILKKQSLNTKMSDFK